MSTADQKPRVEDDDDLDDLDDVLDQFSPQVRPNSSPPPPRPVPVPASTLQSTVADTPDDEFTTQFTKEMESFFKDLGIDPRANSEGPSGVAQREQLSAAWERILIDGMNGTDETQAGMHAETSSSPGPKEDDFQSRIRSTMNKLKETESGLKSSDSTATAGGDDFESLLSQLKGMGNIGDDAENEEQLQGMLEAMMGQLMNKDVLYEPLKELHEKFPGYITEKSSSISPEDKKRFEAQIACIKRLLDEFEAKSYRDDDEKAREKIVELMTELQSHGSPPEEIMGPLPPGLSMGADGLPNMPDSCNLN